MMLFHFNIATAASTFHDAVFKAVGGGRVAVLCVFARNIIIVERCDGLKEYLAAWHALDNVFQAKIFAAALHGDNRLPNCGTLC